MDMNNSFDSINSFFVKIGNFDPLNIFRAIRNFFNFIFAFFSSNSEYTIIWSTVKTFIGAVAIFFVFVMAYCFVRLIELRRKEAEHLALEIKNYAQKYKEKELKMKNLPKNPQWGNVLDHFNQGENGWRLAILEADLMLNSMLEQLNFSGETLGEKLKSINFDKYPNLRSSWEAHGVRNKIAHEGSNFILSDREAKRILAIYEQIFRDFNFI